MDRHGVAGPLRVPLLKKLHQQGVVPQGMFRQPVPVLSGDDGRLHRLADDGQKAGHKLIVGGPDNGGVELPVGLGPVLPGPDEAIEIIRKCLANYDEKFDRQPR